MRKVRILQEAADEAIAAANWYDKECEGLGAEFANAVEIAIDLIEEDILPLSPMPGKAGANGVRRLILKRFPYDIVITESTEEVIVLAVAHHSRKPGYWRQRISLERV
jgi:toxin ParE1/3/4